MRVAVNTRLLLKNKLEGIGWFTFEVMKRMVKNHPEVEFIFLFDRPFDKEFIFASNVKGVVVFPQARHPFLYHWWFEYSLPKVLRKEKADVFFSPEGYISLKSDIPAVNVIHDINFEHHPEGVKPFHRRHFRKFFPKYARKSKRIITVSEFSKEDIINTYGIAEDKIVVAYNGVGSQYHEGDEERNVSIRSKYTKGSPYILFVGAIHPRKNIVGLLKAFDQFKNKTHNEYGESMKLLVVGNKHFWTKDMEATYSAMKHKENVIFVGRVDGAALVDIYGAAKMLAFVPLFEGFGLPIVEAFKSHIPVITSNTSAMPEVAGDAAIIVDPNNHREIADAMSTLAEDSEKAKECIEKGKKRGSQFDWNNTAEIIWREIKSLTDG